MDFFQKLLLSLELSANIKYFVTKSTKDNRTENMQIDCHESLSCKRKIGQTEPDNLRNSIY